MGCGAGEGRVRAEARDTGAGSTRALSGHARGQHDCPGSGSVGAPISQTRNLGCREGGSLSGVTQDSMAEPCFDRRAIGRQAVLQTTPRICHETLNIIIGKAGFNFPGSDLAAILDKK